MSAIVQGVVYRNGEDVAYGTQGKLKRQIVVFIDGQYPQKVPVIFHNEKCGHELDQFPVGAPIKIHVNYGGREWVNPQGEEIFFLELQGWKVE